MRGYGVNDRVMLLMRLLLFAMFYQHVLPASVVIA